MDKPIVVSPPRTASVVTPQQQGLVLRDAAKVVVAQRQLEQRTEVAPERAWAPINSTSKDRKESGPDTFEELVSWCLSLSSFTHTLQPSAPSLALSVLRMPRFR